MDKDMQKGIRAMVSGGLYEVDDDALDRLITEAANVQRSRGNAPALDEVKYLEEYLALCEEAAQYYTEEDSYLPSRFETALADLNQKYPNVANQKTEILSGNLSGDPAWVPSMIC